MRRGSRNSPPAAATSPRVTSGSPNFASSLATTRSQDSDELEAAGQRVPLDRGDRCGLAGGRSVMPPKPRPPAGGFSPARKPFRSMPAQNVPPAPVSISAATSGRGVELVDGRRDAAGDRLVDRVTGLGRLIVMTAMPPSTSTDTAASPLTWAGT